MKDLNDDDDKHHHIAVFLSFSCGYSDETGFLSEEILDSQQTGKQVLNKHPEASKQELLLSVSGSQWNIVMSFVVPLQCAALDGKCSISCEDEVCLFIFIDQQSRM